MHIRPTSARTSSSLRSREARLAPAYVLQSGNLFLFFFGVETRALSPVHIRSTMASEPEIKECFMVFDSESTGTLSVKDTLVSRRNPRQHPQCSKFQWWTCAP